MLLGVRNTLKTIIPSSDEVFSLAMATVDDETKAQFYSASLGFYKTFMAACFGSAENMVTVRQHDLFPLRLVAHLFFHLAQVMNQYAISREGLAFAGASGELPGVSPTSPPFVMCNYLMGLVLP